SCSDSSRAREADLGDSVSFVSRERAALVPAVAPISIARASGERRTEVGAFFDAVRPCKLALLLHADVVHQLGALVPGRALAIPGVRLRSVAAARAVDDEIRAARHVLRRDRDRDRLVATGNHALGLAALRFLLRLPVGAAHAPLEVVGEANAGLALERLALGIDLVDGEPAEIGLVLVLGDAGITDAAALAPQGEQRDHGNFSQRPERKRTNHRRAVRKAQ